MEGGRRCCHQAASPIKLESKKRVEDVKRYSLVGRLMRGGVVGVEKHGSQENLEKHENPEKQERSLARVVRRC